MTSPADAPTPQSLTEELAAAKSRIADLTHELEATNQGIIALYSELETARVAQAKAMAEREVAAERDRIAVELQENTVRQLFSIGLSLQSVTSLVERREAVTRIRSAVDEIDAVIAQLRAAVFGRGDDTKVAVSLLMQVNEVVVEASDRLGFSPSLGFDGPIDKTVSGQAAAELLAAARALLAAVPADTTWADVRVEVDKEVRLLIQYDSGTPADLTTSKIVGEYVQHVGGRLSSEPAGDGTRLTWSVPLPGPSDGE